MADSRTLSIFSLLLIIKVISGQVVNVGDDFNFTSTCADALFKLTTRDNSQTVATRVNGVWSPEAHYRGRIEHISASSVGLTDVNYNDEGAFEFICGRSAIAVFQLEVMTPFEVNLREGDPVRLQCHSFTAGSPATRVKWEKDGELLFELDPSSKETTFHGGRKVSPDWNLKGDVSVFWDRVKLEDRGDYICYCHDKKGERRVVAWRVKVKKRNQDETTSPPPHDCKGVGTGTTVAVTVVMMGLLAAAFLGAFWWLKCRNERKPVPRADIPLQSVEAERLTESGSAGSPVNGWDSQPNGINGC